MKRLLPLLIGALTALVAFSAAFGVNTAIRLAVRVPDDVTLETYEPSADGETVATASPDATPSAPPAPAGRSRKQYVDAILQRNIFDAAAIGKSSTTAAPTVATLSLRLIATMVAEPEEFSSALIMFEGQENSARGYSLNHRIQDAEVVAIEPRKVTLRRGDGNLEFLTMDDRTATMPGAPTTTIATPTDGEALDGVTQLGENKYQIERRLIEQYMGDLDALSRMARAIPHKGPDGEIDGYRLSGIRRNSPLSQLGIKNGDVIHNVNGTSLASMGEAMGALQGLASQSQFNFEVTRRGQRQTMEYTVK